MIEDVLLYMKLVRLLLPLLLYSTCVICMQRHVCSSVYMIAVVFPDIIATGLPSVSCWHRPYSYTVRTTEDTLSTVSYTL
jgi:hypothetical protein